MTKEKSILDVVPLSTESEVDMRSTESVGSITGTGRPKQRASVYLRVSDKKLELDRQKHMIKEWLENNKDKYELGEVYMEKMSSRGGVPRKQLNRMMKDAKLIGSM